MAFALTHDLHDPFPDENYADFLRMLEGEECTMFVSAALSVGGLVDRRDSPADIGMLHDYMDVSYWPGYESTKMGPADSYENFFFNRSPNSYASWMRTPELYNFLTDIKGFRASTYKDVPHFFYNTQFYPNWVNLEHQNTKWTLYLNLLHRWNLIEKGDVVFYKNIGQADWNHAAMIVGWEPQTYFGVGLLGVDEYGRISPSIYLPWYDLVCYGGPPTTIKPRVVERDGVIVYKNSRSIDNTASPIGEISIVHIQ